VRFPIGRKIFCYRYQRRSSRDWTCISIRSYKFTSLIQFVYQWLQGTACDPAVKLVYGIIYRASVRRLNAVTNLAYIRQCQVRSFAGTQTMKVSCTCSVPPERLGNYILTLNYIEALYRVRKHLNITSAYLIKARSCAWRKNYSCSSVDYWVTRRLMEWMKQSAVTWCSTGSVLQSGDCTVRFIILSSNMKLHTALASTYKCCSRLSIYVIYWKELHMIQLR
jgi:hypothetical protein